ncbi:MAG: hypothetical protein ACRDCH_00090 [Metamycoplasmataceae bacterium]
MWKNHYRNHKYQITLKRLRSNSWARRKLDTGDIFGTFKGKLKIMSNSKKTTVNDLAKIMNKGFERINKRLDIIDKKIDLILATPTIKKEIDHKALSELN